MRRLGYLVVDRLVEWNESLADGRAGSVGSRADLGARLAGPAPEDGGSFEDRLGELVDDVLPYGQRTGHARFMGYVPGAATWPAVLGDLLADGCNVFGGSWLGSSGATTVELVVLDWISDWLGLPEGAGGLLTSGGSEANLLAVLCARRTILDDRPDGAVAYLSAHTHESVLRALRAAGGGGLEVRRLAVDPHGRLRPDETEQAMVRDREAGLRPFLLVANAGTTNTGAVDDLPALAEVSAAHGAWLHVDAAYGGFFSLTDRGRRLLDGLGRADSVTVDPHKGLAQPWGTGCVLVRDNALLERTFRMQPDYLRDARVSTEYVNLYDRGLQLTRPARALKIWLSVQALGLGAFRAALDGYIDLATLGQTLVERHPNGEIVFPASLGIVTFRRRDGDDEQAASRLNASGLGHVSTTVLDERVTLRLCVNSFRTTPADVHAVVDALLS
jgi:glutamate/tyrosine decarboxylase-like PLP-dependent enzyme